MLILVAFATLLCTSILTDGADVNGNQISSIEHAATITEGQSSKEPLEILLEDVSTELPSFMENSTDTAFSTENGFSSFESEDVSTTEKSFETTSRRSLFQFKPQFEHNTYDFMVPEGTNPVSTNLAVISYMGKKEKPMPVFKISFDRMRWFEIGNITSKELDNYVEYKVMINQRPEVYVQYNLTKDGTYKFLIEAHDDGSMETASIRVDVLSFSPTTRRKTTTAAPTTPSSTTTTRTTPADLLQTTTPPVAVSTTVELSIDSVLDSSSTSNTSSESSTQKIPESDTTATPAVDTTAIPAVATPVVPVVPIIPASKSVSNDLRSVQESDDTSNEDEDLVLTALNSDVSERPPNPLLPSGSVMTTESPLSKEHSHGPKLIDQSAEIPIPRRDSKGKQIDDDDDDLEAERDGGETEVEGSGTSSTSTDEEETTTDSFDATFVPDTSSSTDEVSKEEEIDNDTTLPASTSTTTESTTESTRESESSSEEAEELEIIFEGTKNGTFKIESSTPLNPGDLVRGLAISLRISPKGKNSYTNISLDRTDVVDIKPKLLYTGNKAYLFVKNPSALSSPVRVKVMAERATSAAIKELTLVGSPAKSSSSPSETATDDGKVAVDEYEFSIAENAPSGSTVGQIKNGQSKRVVGPPGLFSLLGSDLILSCPNEASCLDYEKQNMHHVLLVDAEGKKSPPVYVKVKVQDVNDNQPRLQGSDKFIRISDNRLIMPFVVETHWNLYPFDLNMSFWVIDADEPATSKNRLTLSGSAASFLDVKEISTNLYQVDVIGFAPVGHHQLEFTVTDGDSSSTLTVEVQVQNTKSRAHFRRTKYTRSINAEKVHQGNQLLQVELEGVPIDEARFIILHGNPGWLTIDDYGGRVGVAKFISPVESGTYLVDIGAVDRQSNALLAQTQVEIKVVGGAEPDKKVFTKRFFKRTLDREESTDFSVPFKLKKLATVSVDSVLAIDENGQQSDLKKSDVTIRKHSVVFKKSSLANLRVVSVVLLANEEKATVMLTLTSSPQFIEHQQKEAARPMFPRPWTRETPTIELSIMEELPKGQIIYVLPAVNPVDGSLVPVTVEGDMKEAFEHDPTTGAISIVHRLDVDTMAPSDRTFSLKFIAGDSGYESVAELKITVENKDDNPPVIEKEGLNSEIPIPENLPPHTIIARLQVTDEDRLGSVDEFSVEKSGIGSEMYSASIMNGSLVVAVADNGTLDREVRERHMVHMIVRDGAGNQDSATLYIVLLDINDNAPRFTQDQYAIQVIDNWPTGIVVDRLKATDIDAGENGCVTYSLASGSTKYLSIDPKTGELKISGELAGAAREQPYEVVVIAEDSGTPSLSSSVRIKLKISEPLMDEDGEKGQVVFVDPPVDFVLNLKEDIPVNEHVYAVKARLAGVSQDRMNIKYSLKDWLHSSPAEQHFDIDESSGEVYVTKALDYEETKFYTLVVTAWNVFDPSKNATRVLRVAVEDVDDVPPEFPRGATMLFTVPHSSKTTNMVIGRVSAIKRNRDVFHYYLLPNCTQEFDHFSVDGSTGEVSLTATGESKLPDRVELCFLASRYGGLNVDDVVFDAKNVSMLRAAVVFEKEEPSIAQLPRVRNNTVVVLHDNLRGATIPLAIPESLDHGLRYSIDHVQFTPVQNGTGVPNTSTESLFFVDPIGGEISANPQLADQPQGVYSVVANAVHPKSAQPLQHIVRKFHYVKDEMKLRYVFSMKLEEFASNREQFSKKLQEALKIDHPEGQMQVFLSEPKMDTRNSSRTAVCFHVVLNEQIQSERSAISAVSQTAVENSELSKLYHIYKVINIERCQENPMPVAQQSSFHISSQLLLLIAFVALLVVVLISLLTYVCFVQRYKDHLRAREKQMKGSLATSSQLSYSPTFILPPGGPRHY
ncbi:hypothetical protein V3C99_008936 [Haemonchus contortus]